MSQRVGSSEKGWVGHSTEGVRGRFVRVAGIVLIAAVLSVGLLYWQRYRVAWSATFLLAPGDVEAVEPGGATAAGPVWFERTEGSTSSAPAVFYLHPTTLIRGGGWNQSPSVWSADGFLEMVGGQHVEVVAGAGEVWAPHYRQATFYSFVEPEGRGEEALDLASRDVIAAFSAFAASNPDRPWLLVGHSQGAYHLLRLLQSLDSAQLDHLVAAYVIGYPVPEWLVDEGGVSLSICSSPGDHRCLVTYNVRSEDAYIPPFFRQVPVPRLDGSWQRLAAGDRLVCTNVVAGGPVAARCASDGWLEISEPKDEAFRSFLMSRGWYHTVEIPLFAAELVTDMERRTRAWRVERVSP